MLLGAAGIGLGVAFLLGRIFLEVLESKNSVINSNFNIIVDVIGLVLIFLGILSVIIGILAIRHSHKWAARHAGQGEWE
jgi:hypothetical protein